MKNNVKIRITTQYLKDLSFESPLAPRILLVSTKEIPNISIEFDISSVKLNSSSDANDEIQVDFYEVTMHITSKATIQDENIAIENQNTAFICDVKYAAIVAVENPVDSTEENVKTKLLIQVPSMIFPFAREIIAKSTSSAGFPPLMLDPVDFEATYKKNK